ncbi:helix-turn-helix transcriptional regulator [Pseudochrobactrum asaccharolyticum]|uniref:Helix-turn-helix protein n=1 Tax=Pseudochrobactrum asaccharolyticum TaxID=354351 RepID=A0A366DLH8_9HYPH|nr:helix-turn-helix transcriptional regulator [Pseudochrobactrum asaccharolyticum]RBO90933.1 helix-turn-helix protein [Pseudochrobactrum asaccharolyticum]
MTTFKHSLGTYLKDRRSKLDPAALGFSGARRRTPGLRREEVALRANISPTWYTWLEQGRGGAPSPDVLDRIAKGLMLTEPEREHIYMLALGHPPEVRYCVPEGVTPRLQRLLDAFETSPAIIKTALWDVVAWNRAATAVLTDYSKLSPSSRNILRIVFCTPEIRDMQMDWNSIARSVVGAFRADAIRAGASREISELVDELCTNSAEFAALWQNNDVEIYGEGIKRLQHPTVGLIELEYSGFAVDGRADLSLIVYNPASEADKNRIKTLMKGRGFT